MGLFWDSKEEKKEKQRLVDLEIKRIKIEKERQFELFMKSSEKERFKFLLEEIERLDSYNKKQDSEIRLVKMLAYIK